jgi:hypothetical protein
MAQITYSTKVDNQASELPAINKVTAADMNEIKASVNELYDERSGWARYDDTQYTSALPYVITGETPFTVSNNAGSVINNEIHSAVPFYDASTQKIQAEGENDVYILTFAFKAKIENANGYMDVYLEGGNGTPYERVHQTVAFPRGNNVEHTFAINLVYYADSDVVTNGLSLKVEASHNGNIYDVIYFVQCTQKHKDH